MHILLWVWLFGKTATLFALAASPTHQVIQGQCREIRSGVFADPSSCGKIARYVWIEGDCYALDSSGKSLGYVERTERCPKNYVRYIQHFGNCHGVLKDGSIGGYVSPGFCHAPSDRERPSASDAGVTGAQQVH